MSLGLVVVLYQYYANPSVAGSDNFLLMSGEDFLLMDFTNFLLMGI